MKFAQLGSTGLSISRVGLGAWAIGGNLWGPQDDAESIATIRHAIERGVNWIDTAAIYGNGHSEVILGRALKDIPADKRPFVFTKGGLSWRHEQRWRSGKAGSLRIDVEDSLKRLNIETIDLYQMHWPVEDVPLEQYWQTLLDLRDEGKVRHVGLSNHDTAQLARCEALGHVETLQPPFSMIRREAADDVLPWCHRHRTGVIIYSPMQSGLLTGTFSKARFDALAETDFRRTNPEFQSPALERSLALVEALRPIAEKHHTSVGSVALAWTLTWQGISGAIVGGRSPAQVDGWVDSVDVMLDTDDLATIATAIGTSAAGAGPAHPLNEAQS